MKYSSVYTIDATNKLYTMCVCVCLSFIRKIEPRRIYFNRVFFYYYFSNENGKDEKKSRKNTIITVEMKKNEQKILNAERVVGVLPGNKRRVIFLAKI